MPLNEQKTVKTLGNIAADALTRIVYCSNLTFVSRLMPSIFRAVESEARNYNEQHNITGILCYGNGRFLQCLEGDKQVLLSLLRQIVEDRRHKNVKILLIQPIQYRSFSNWNMRLMFLERWLWSPETKKQADGLSAFLPFKPESWDSKTVEVFLDNIQCLATPPHVNNSAIKINALAHMMRHIAGPHQVFILVQGVLTILVLIAFFLLYYLHFK